MKAAIQREPHRLDSPKSFPFTSPTLSLEWRFRDWPYHSKKGGGGIEEAFDLITSI